MIRFIKENTKLRNGLNIYPWSDRKNSIGFKLRFGNRCWQVRYNPTLKFVVNKIHKV